MGNKQSGPLYHSVEEQETDKKIVGSFPLFMCDKYSWAPDLFETPSTHVAVHNDTYPRASFFIRLSEKPLTASMWGKDFSVLSTHQDVLFPLRSDEIPVGHIKYGLRARGDISDLSAKTQYIACISDNNLVLTEVVLKLVYDEKTVEKTDKVIKVTPQDFEIRGKCQVQHQMWKNVKIPSVRALYNQLIVEIDGLKYNVPAGIVTPKTTKITLESADKRIYVTGTKMVQGQFDKNFVKNVKSDIAGLDDIIEDIYNQLIVPRTLKYNMEEFGLKLPLGAIFEGPPGTGKTLLAESIAKRLNGRIKCVLGPELKNSFYGKSEENVRALFDEPRKDYEKNGQQSTLYVLFLDELSSLCENRNSSSNSSNKVDCSVTEQVLACMSAKDLPPNLIIFGTTNRIEAIDPAILRQGRLGIVYKFSLPNREQRQSILKLYVDKIPSDYCYVSRNDPDRSPLLPEQIVKKLEKFAADSGGLCSADLSSAVIKTKMMHLSASSKLSEGDPAIYKLCIDDIGDALTERKSSSIETYVLWNSELKEFTDAVISNFNLSSPGIAFWYAVAGSGVCSLVRYLARECMIGQTISIPLGGVDISYSKEDSIVLGASHSDVAGLVECLKLAGKRVVAIVRGSPNNQHEFERVFRIPTVESREEYERLKSEFCLDVDFDGGYPVPFSRLFKRKALPIKRVDLEDAPKKICLENKEIDINKENVEAQEDKENNGDGKAENSLQKPPRLSKKARRRQKAAAAAAAAADSDD